MLRDFHSPANVIAVLRRIFSRHAASAVRVIFVRSILRYGFASIRTPASRCRLAPWRFPNGRCEQCLEQRPAASCFSKLPPLIEPGIITSVNSGSILRRLVVIAGASRRDIADRGDCMQPGTTSIPDVAQFRAAADRNVTFRAAVARSGQASFPQAQQSAAWNPSHFVEACLSRWLLRVRFVRQRNIAADPRNCRTEMMAVQRDAVSTVPQRRLARAMAKPVQEGAPTCRFFLPTMRAAIIFYIEYRAQALAVPGTRKGVGSFGLGSSITKRIFVGACRGRF